VGLHPDPLDQAPYVTLSRDQLDAVIGRHHLGISTDDVRPLPSMGIVHTIYAMGDGLVLRVPKAHPEAVSDSYTGMVATPVAHATGISTAALVAFDEELDIAPVPLSVYERAPGKPLHSSLGVHLQEFESVWCHLGREVATLHASVQECPDPHGYLDEHDHLDDHVQLLEELRAAGYVGKDAATWLDEVLARIRPSLALSNTYRRFIHGDVTPGNVLIHDARYRSIIDWDDAGWADPALEFAALPLRAVDMVLAGYRSVIPLDGDDSAEQRILWDKITGALRRLWREPRPPTSPTSSTVAGPLIDLFAAAADGDTPIMRLLRR